LTRLAFWAIFAQNAKLSESGFTGLAEKTGLHSAFYGNPVNPDWLRRTDVSDKNRPKRRKLNEQRQC
jgi:hypothetical protein